MSKQEMPLQMSLYPISAVAELTGINPITLRAWERRYDLVKPNRSDSGRRLYSLADVQKIKAVKQYLDQGLPIRRAIAILEKDLELPAEIASASDVWQKYLQMLETAIKKFDEQALDEAYHEITSLHPIDMVTQNLILPLLEKLGDQWDTEEGRVAEEHFFSTYLRNKIGARFHNQSRLNNGKKVIIGGLPGDFHEFGLLLFALALLNRGMCVLVLGPNLPLSELLHVEKITQPAAIVLAGTYEADINPLIAKLRVFSTKVDVPVFIGGSIASKYEDTLKTSGVHPIGSDIRTGVNKLLNTLSPKSTEGNHP